MTYRLQISLNPEVKNQLNRNKKIWNFVKSDLETLFQNVSAESKISVTQAPQNTFMIEYNLIDQLPQKYMIGPDLSFAEGLDLTLDDPALLSLLLAIIICLKQFYKSAFTVTCTAYPIVDAAMKYLQKAHLQPKRSSRWLETFIDCPLPGRPLTGATPLSRVEVRRKIISKKRAEGKCSISTWLTESVKAELDDFCKIRGLNLEEALNQIIPIGINTTCLVNKISPTANSPQ